jgi:hypothetical protein
LPFSPSRFRIRACKARRSSAWPSLNRVA